MFHYNQTNKNKQIKKQKNITKFDFFIQSNNEYMANGECEEEKSEIEEKGRSERNKPHRGEKDRHRVEKWKKRV